MEVACSRPIRTILAVLVAALAGVPAFAAGPARVVVVQPRIDLADVATYDTFRANLLGLVEAQVRPQLANDRPNLIIFPEDVGLPAAFIGSRGAPSRSAPSILYALGGHLPAAYQAPLYYYFLRYPMQGVPVTDGQLLCLALTDTLWRAFSETMREVAVSTGAWVMASTNVSGCVEPSIDMMDMGYLQDPDLPWGPVYVARDPNVYNTAFVFSPEGEIVAQARKSYLVPDEEQLLGFSYGPLADLQPIDLGFGRLGVLTSKDAWMPDVVDRLAILGSNVFVQPEAFRGWTILQSAEMPDDWLPDVVQQSGWQAVQKHGAYRAGLIPHLTGNLIDMAFDGQSAILGDAIPGTTAHAYVGQDPQGGFLSTAPWVIPDPGIADPALSLDERRGALRALGWDLLRGGGHANQYVETAIAADLSPDMPYPVEPAGPAGALGPSTALADAAGGEQCHAAVAVHSAGHVLVAWEDTRDGRPQVYLAQSGNGAKTFGPGRCVAPSPNAQRTPALVVTPRSVYLAWQEEVAGGHRILVARSGDKGKTFGMPCSLTAPGAADEWLPALAADDAAPPRSGQAHNVYLAFVAAVGGNERICVARTRDAAMDWQVTPADAGAPPYPAGNPRNNQWSPAIAARGGEVAVAWVDFRAYNWDVYLSRSTDAGRTFGAAARVDDGTDGPERIHNDPCLAWSPDCGLLCAWTDVRQRQAPATARVALGTPGFGPSTLVAGAAAGTCSWRPRVAPIGRGAVAAAWQDFRALGNDIYLAVSTDGGASFGAEQRIDDGGEGPSYQFAPRIASVLPGRVLVVWEDTRTGRRQLRYVVGAVE